MSWKPEIEGTLPVRSSATRFMDEFCQRVEVGLLLGRPGSRSNYEIVESGKDKIRVRAADWWTAIGIGLNDLELSIPEKGNLRFQLHYWRWTFYCVGLGFCLGMIGIAVFTTMDIRNYIANHPGARFPWLSLDQNLYFAWGNVVFWGFIWPWLLVSLHKRPLRRVLARLVEEVDDNASEESPVIPCPPKK